MKEKLLCHKYVYVLVPVLSLSRYFKTFLFNFLALHEKLDFFKVYMHSDYKKFFPSLGARSSGLGGFLSSLPMSAYLHCAGKFCFLRFYISLTLTCSYFFSSAALIAPIPPSTVSTNSVPSYYRSTSNISPTTTHVIILWMLYWLFFGC